MFNKLCLFAVSRHKGGVICTASWRHYSQDFKVIRTDDTAFLRRGTGGRSSFNGNVITVFGATGFLGQYICTRLASKGAQLIIPHRCDISSEPLKRLKLAGDLGQVQFLPFDLHDAASIRRAIKYSNIVINLIGRDFETKKFSSYEVHVKSAKEIAEACKEMNIERLIHFSSLNLTDEPKRYYIKKIKFLQGKKQGEEALLEVFPTATVFRPSNVFGYFDRFLWPLCVRMRTLMDSVPLYEKGMKTIKQPIFVSDVASAVYNAIEDYSTRGKIYQAVGPERFYLKDISQFCSQVLQRHHYNSSLVHDIKYDLLFFLKILCFRGVMEFTIHEPIRHLAFEYIERESVTDVVDPNLPTVADLGVELTKFEDVVPHLIYKYFRKYSCMALDSYNYVPPDSLSAKALSDFSF